MVYCRVIFDRRLCIRHVAKNINCLALFATHFHELTVLADQVPSVCNRHVLVHAAENEMTLLYKVQDGK